MPVRVPCFLNLSRQMRTMFFLSLSFMSLYLPYTFMS